MNKRTKPIGISLLACGVVTAAMAETVGFDTDVTGSVPAGWTGGVTGRGSARWTVEADPGAPSPHNVLRQAGRGDFPWCVKRDVSLVDGFVEVKFKPLSGQEDQAGGVVWRWKDGNNYYVARANALEDNVSLYYTQDGRRNTIKYVTLRSPRERGTCFASSSAASASRSRSTANAVSRSRMLTSPARARSAYGPRPIA
jgi:hypothetical protein